MHELYQKCYETLVNEYTVGDFFREVYEAKKEFFDELGIVNEEDAEFENQMDIFMGWYLFDRPLRQFDLAPVHLYYRKNLEKFSATEESLYKKLTETRHSIYELLKQKNNLLVLRDLSTGYKVDVIDNNFNMGFSKGDIFEARLIPLEKKSFCFASGFCFHPKEAYKFIESQMKKLRQQDYSQRTKILMKLSQMKFKQQRFPHIDVDYIYTLTPKF
jgi:hypothetical protein